MENLDTILDFPQITGNPRVMKKMFCILCVAVIGLFASPLCAQMRDVGQQGMQPVKHLHRSLSLEFDFRQEAIARAGLIVSTGGEVVLFRLVGFEPFKTLSIHAFAN
jgi:hypothetical protein